MDNKDFKKIVSDELINAGFALTELNTIKEELRTIPANKVIWDIDDLEKMPPWGENISKGITDMSNYFVTSEGEDFLTIFKHALEKSQELGLPIEIESF